MNYRTQHRASMCTVANEYIKLATFGFAWGVNLGGWARMNTESDVYACVCIYAYIYIYI